MKQDLKNCRFIPKVLQITCVAGLLVGEATALAFFLELSSHRLRGVHGFSLTDEVMTLILCTQLILLIPFVIWVLRKKWVQVEFDSKAKLISRWLRGLSILAIGGYISIGIQMLHPLYWREYRVDIEMIGVSIMHICGSIALFSFARKYRPVLKNTEYTTIENKGSYKKSNIISAIIIMAMVVAFLVSNVLFFKVKAERERALYGEELIAE